jgi:8-oxo-dGTP diphosphatase
MLDDAIRVSVALVVRPATRVGQTPLVLIGHRLPFGHLASLWEFPGGKVEIGESSADCVRREVLEEVGLGVRVERLILTQQQQYPDRQVVIDFHLCRWVSGIPQTIECQAVRWVRPEHLEVYRFPEGNQAVLRTLAEVI